MKKEFNSTVGYIGEFDACEYLKKKNYKILAKNYSNKIGEIDIIAIQGNVIVFVEVKTRKTLAFGRPSEAVNFPKQQKIRRCAEWFLVQKKLMESPCRFDVIEVVDQEINHIENAF